MKDFCYFLILKYYLLLNFYENEYCYPNFYFEFFSYFFNLYNYIKKTINNN